LLTICLSPVNPSKKLQSKLYSDRTSIGDDTLPVYCGTFSIEILNQMMNCFEYSFDRGVLDSSDRTNKITSSLMRIMGYSTRTALSLIDSGFPLNAKAPKIVMTWTVVGLRGIGLRSPLSNLMNDCLLRAPMEFTEVRKIYRMRPCKECRSAKEPNYCFHHKSQAKTSFPCSALGID
jgi:hypothetical protein